MNKAIKVSIERNGAVLKSALFLNPMNAMQFAANHMADDVRPSFSEASAMFGVTLSHESMPDDPWGDEGYEENVYLFTTKEKAEAWARAKAESLEGDGTQWVPDPNTSGGTMLIQGNEVTRISIGLVEVDQTEV